MGFFRVLFIFFYITDIVDDVDTARYEGEEEESFKGKDDICCIEQITRKNESGKNEKVFDPLLQSH